MLFLICGSLTMSYIEWNGSKSAFWNFKKIRCITILFFQYIYYIFEIVLVTLILVFGQIACEKWFKRVNIPYGGIVIAITWGMGHFLTKDFSTGNIMYVFLGLAYGSIYLLVNRDIRKTYLIFVGYVCFYNFQFVKQLIKRIWRRIYSQTKNHSAK